MHIPAKPHLEFSRIATLVILVACVAGCATTDSHDNREATNRAASLIGTRATYCRAPRTADNRVDVQRLINELIELHANTYSFCIHSYATDWDDLKLILPAARAKGIRIWASIVPPSESPPRLKMYAEPFRLDYVRWAVEFARLSLEETNLVAWSIDDFTHNLKFYTPEYTKQMLEESRMINPKLAFVPCCYFPTINSSFATNYAPFLDGILFPYRHESAGSNLKDPSLIASEIHQLHETVGPNLPIVVDIYATAHSRLGPTTPAYVREAMRTGSKEADGVMIYCHQDPNKEPEKYQIIKEVFGSTAKH